MWYVCNAIVYLFEIVGFALLVMGLIGMMDPQVRELNNIVGTFYRLLFAFEDDVDNWES